MTTQQKMQRHVRECKQCQKAKKLEGLCKKVRKFVNQDYCQMNEDIIDPAVLDSGVYESVTNWTARNSSKTVQAQVTQLISQLNSKDQAIIRGRIWEGKTYERLAHELGYVFKGAVKNRETRIHKRLMGYLPTQDQNLKSSQALIKTWIRIPNVEEGKNNDNASS